MAYLDPKEALKEIGLTEGETAVYLALLKLGSSNVHQLKKETKIHRTTIYDFLEGLANKGLISDLIEKGMHYYTAAPPQKLFGILETKKDHLGLVMKTLEDLSKFEKQEIKVEVFRGKEGFRTVTNEISKRKSELLGFGIDEKKFEEVLGIEMLQIFRKEKEAGITERIITWEGAKFIYGEPHIQYRFIPRQYFSPTPITIFSDIVSIQIWEPFTIIMIKNKELAESYKKHFELLWSIATPAKNKRKKA